MRVQLTGMFAGPIGWLLMAAPIVSTAAATDNPSPPESASYGLEEIIVTAQKTAEKLRDVPISITVITGDQITNQHIQDIGDITRVVPNFSFSTSGNPGGSVLEIRGISSESGASTVGVYLDEVPITQRTGYAYVAQPEPMLFDLQQIEVLRGPQGTLYGSSSEGGLIKYRLNPVDLSTFEGSATADLSDTEHGSANINATGVVNLPIIDGIAGVRIGVARTYNSGYIDRYSPDTGLLVDPRTNSQHNEAARLTFEIKLFDSLTITPALFYQRLAYSSSDTLTLDIGPPLATNFRVADPGSDTMIVPSLTIRDDLGAFDLISVTSDYTRSTPYTYDGTAFNSVYIGQCILDGLCGGPPVPDLQGGLAGQQIAVLPAPANDKFFTRNVSEELRLSSKPYSGTGIPLIGTLGLYYADTINRVDDDEYINNFNNVFTSLYGAQTLASIFGGPLPNNVIFAYTHWFEEKEYSAFGELSYLITPALKLTAGLRYLSAKQSLYDVGYGFFYGTNDTATGTDHAVTPKISATYEMSKDASIYATVSKGFRLGAPNPPIAAGSLSFCGPDLSSLGLTQAPGSYGHDSLWNYEVGVKARVSPQLAVNAALFDIHWTRLQQTFELPTCGFAFTANVGSARSYGTEIDLAYQPIQYLTVNLAGGYTNAVLTQTVASLPFIIAGERIEGVPTYNGTVSGEYRLPLSATDTAFVRLNYNRTGNSHGSLVPTDPDYQRPAYGVAGGSLGLTLKAWEFSVYAKNLFNNQEIIQTPDHATVPVGFTLRPRTVGIAVAGKY
jgi:iron complex outermembrane recepter protein